MSLTGGVSKRRCDGGPPAEPTPNLATRVLARPAPPAARPGQPAVLHGRPGARLSFWDAILPRFSPPLCEERGVRRDRSRQALAGVAGRAPICVWCRWPHQRQPQQPNLTAPLKHRRFATHQVGEVPLQKTSRKRGSISVRALDMRAMICVMPRLHHERRRTLASCSARYLAVVQISVSQKSLTTSRYSASLSIAQ